jgi:hypothetical protein
MIQTTVQKTEYWILGVIQRFKFLGIIKGTFFDDKLSTLPENLDWWELDGTREEWCDSDIFKRKMNEFFNQLYPIEKVIMINNLGYFFIGGEVRTQFMRSAFSNLFDGKS